MITKIEVPNVDDHSVVPEDVEYLRDEFMAISTVFLRLAQYADVKSAAMKCRLLGNLEDAIEAEKTCELIYALLPDWAKW